MTEKTKIVEVAGTRYQLSRFPANVGSFILMKLIGAGLTGMNVNGNQEAPAKVAAEPSGEEIVRAFTFAASSRGLTFDEHNWIQQKCLSVCARLEDHSGVEVPMPLMTSSGVTLPEIRDDLQLAMKLEIETLVFNYSSFFAEGGLNALAGTRPSTA